MTPHLIGIVGDATFDYDVDVAGVHAGDEKLVPVATTRSLGGTGANAAVVAQALGSRASLHAVVGDDAIGAWIVSALQDRGVSTAHVRVVPGPSPIATVIRGSRRTVVVDIGVGVPTQVELDDLRLCALVYVSYSPQTAVTLVAAGLGERTVVGVEAWMLSEPGFRAALDGCRLVIANEAAFSALESSGGLPAAPLVCTRGALGATLHGDGDVIDIPPYPVDAVDATGAGDCFAATLCHYLADGAELAAAARLAAVAAALSTLHVGAQEALPSPQDLESRT